MVKIITDSTCDITLEEQKSMGITVVPLSVNFGEKSYKDGIQISREEFYNKLELAEELPTTSQVNPAEFEDAFREALKDGDDVVAICLSSELSGTYQSAVLAADMIESEKLYLVDTGTVTLGLALLIKEAVKLRDAGHNGKEIATRIQETSKRVQILAVIDTLKYLKMGGRLSATSAMVGSFLGIHPILKVQEGKILPIGKVRSIKAGIRKLKEYLEEEGVDYTYGFAFGHSNATDKLEHCMEYMTPYVDTKDFIICNIGSVVGTHAGPGVVGIAFITK